MTRRRPDRDGTIAGGTRSGSSEKSEALLDGLRSALEASWDERTSYGGVLREGNPAVGQCYPTSWVVHQLDPRMEIVRGTVAAADGLHTHFWNVLPVDGRMEHVDLTWQQFLQGAHVLDFEVLDREQLGDSAATVARCELLLRRVRAFS